MTRGRALLTRIVNRELARGGTPVLEIPAMSLADMTQVKWNALPESERAKLRDLSGLNPQLMPFEGDRVEVESEMTGEKWRFWVGRSSGWRPCHIQLALRTSRGGMSAGTRPYKSVRLITKGPTR